MKLSNQTLKSIGAEQYTNLVNETRSIKKEFLNQTSVVVLCTLVFLQSIFGIFYFGFMQDKNLLFLIPVGTLFFSGVVTETQYKKWEKLKSNLRNNRFHIEKIEKEITQKIINSVTI